jgi:hypothetical protein
MAESKSKQVVLPPPQKQDEDKKNKMDDTTAAFETVYAVRAGKTCGVFTDPAEVLVAIDDYPGAEIREFKNLGGADEYLFYNNCSHTMNPPLAEGVFVLHCQEVTFVKDDDDKTSGKHPVVISSFAMYDQPEPLHGITPNAPLEKYTIDVLGILTERLQKAREKKPDLPIKIFLGMSRSVVDVESKKLRVTQLTYVIDGLACLDTIDQLGQSTNKHEGPGGLLEPYSEHLGALASLRKTLGRAKIQLLSDRPIINLYPVRVAMHMANKAAFGFYKQIK